MSYTEDDLRELLAERTAYGPGGETSMARIVRHGRRMLLVRWGVGAVTCAAALAAIVLLLPGQRPAPAPAVAQPTATVTTGLPRGAYGLIEPPPADLQGLVRGDSIAGGGSAVGKDLPLTGNSAAVAVRCEDPNAWVVVSVGGGAAGEVVRCAGGLVVHTLSKAAGSGRQKTVRVWVFPADAEVDETPLKDCVVPDKPRGTCNGRYSAKELLRFDVALSLAADLGAQPGGWAAAVYVKR